MIEVGGLVDPVEVDFVTASVSQAARGRAEALVIQLDSGGAVVSGRRLQALRSRLVGSGVPVAVWVGPNGAKVGGGALSLVRAASVVGVAPGAHLRGSPAGAQVVSAATLGDFIVGLDGRPVGGRQLRTATVVATPGGPRRAPVGARFAKLGLLQRLLHTVVSPSVAYLFLVAGLCLVVFEFFTAGVGMAGAVGAGLLVLAAYGLAVLPTRPLPLVLVGAGILGFSIDLQAGAPRTWTVVGLVALAGGSRWLFSPHPVPLLTLLLVLAGVLVLMLGGMPAMLRARFSTPTVGRESMVGLEGTATTAVDPEGTVRVREGLWRARTNRATPITAGERVRVVAIDGLLLEVEPARA